MARDKNQSKEDGRVLVTSDYRYEQNLSMNYEDALHKIIDTGEDFMVDLNLRGDHSFRTKEYITDFEPWQFTFGKLVGQDIRSSDDVWQLNRAMNEEKKKRTRAFARRRLIELGKILKHNGKWVLRTMLEKIQKDEYIASLKSGHLFTDKTRVGLRVKEVERFSFEGGFGRTYVQLLATDEGQLVKYVGTSPVYTLVGVEYTPITATVKHSEYNGKPETRIQRVK